ncbi:hypothetical protein DM02DRAFT_385125 [Periconia macrospinosa]|uniref:Uncharacterized protein n=1 Tax=Periconia macrospinosa TaxID=97972 RepID=A0A2V1DRR2_9PLEO|nr:hypothetical protein DM02DRAFT_385125 [Periconia macrospinosa]
MYTDFLGLRVIWPPDGTRPPTHDHDIVFVHDISNGSISDWEDESGVCWPAEHLSLDLKNTRILAFGYDSNDSGVRSDGLYQGGLVFNHGQNLWTALMTFAKMSDRVGLSYLPQSTSQLNLYSRHRFL